MLCVIPASVSGECSYNSTNLYVQVLLFTSLCGALQCLSAFSFFSVSISPLFNYRLPFIFVSHLHLSLSDWLGCAACGCAVAAFRKCAQPTCAASLLPPTPSLCKYGISRHPSSTHTHLRLCVCVSVCTTSSLQCLWGMFCFTKSLYDINDHRSYCEVHISSS